MEASVLSLIDDLVDQTIGLCLLSRHKIVALGISADLLIGLAGIFGQDLIEPLLDLQHPLHMDLHIGRLTLRAAKRLVSLHQGHFLIFHSLYVLFRRTHVFLRQKKAAEHQHDDRDP